MPHSTPNILCVPKSQQLAQHNSENVWWPDHIWPRRHYCYRMTVNQPGSPRLHMKMTVEIDGKRDGHHSFHLPLSLGQSFNSSSNLGSFGSKGDGVWEIMFHWSTTGIHWLPLAYLLYNHSHQHVFTHGDISGLPPLSLSPSSNPFPPHGSSLALKHSLGSSSGECSVVLILGAPAHIECLHASSWSTHMVSESRTKTTEKATILPRLPRHQKIIMTALQHSVWEAERDYILLHCKIACQGLNPAP